MDLGSGTGTVKNIDFMSVYAKHLADKVRSATGEQLPLKGMKIVVDAGNGAGGFYAKDVLEALGADTSGSRFLQRTGTFPIISPIRKIKKLCDRLLRQYLKIMRTLELFLILT